MWKITKDLIFEEDSWFWEKSEVGKHTTDFDPEKAIFEFRLLDDDGNVYYHGLSDSCDDDNAFEPLDYYMAHSGCTEIQYKVDEKWETL